MFNDERTSDFVISAEGKPIYVHRSVLMTQSPFLKEFLTKDPCCNRINASNALYDAMVICLRALYAEPKDEDSLFGRQRANFLLVLSCWEIAMHFTIQSVSQLATPRLCALIDQQNVLKAVKACLKHPKSKYSQHVIQKCLEYLPPGPEYPQLQHDWDDLCRKHKILRTYVKSADSHSPDVREDDFRDGRSTSQHSTSVASQVAHQVLGLPPIAPPQLLVQGAAPIPGSKRDTDPKQTLRDPQHGNRSRSDSAGSWASSNAHTETPPHSDVEPDRLKSRDHEPPASESDSLRRTSTVESNSPTPILMSPHEKEGEEESYSFRNRSNPKRKEDRPVERGPTGTLSHHVDKSHPQPATQTPRDRFDELVEQYKKVRSPPKVAPQEGNHTPSVGTPDVSVSSRGLSTAALRVRYQNLRSEVDDVQKEFNQLKLQHKRSNSRSRSPRGRGDDGNLGLGAENESAIVEKEMHLKSLEATLTEMKAQYQTQVKEWHNEKKLLEKRLKTISALESQLEEKSSSRLDDVGAVEADSLFVKAADLETLHAEVVPLIRDRAKERAEVRRLRDEIASITSQLKELEDEKAENLKYLDSSAEYRQAALQGAEDVLAHAQTIREAAFSRQAAREAIAHAATKLKEERMSLTALVNEEQIHYTSLEEKQTKEKAQIEFLTQQLTELELDIDGS